MFILCLIIIALIYLIIAVRWIHIRQKRRIINNIRERGPKTYIIFPEEEDSKSKAVQIAEHQRDMVLKDISRLLDGYVNSVMLGTSIRNITYSVEVENLGSITNAEVKFTPLPMSS